MHLSRTRVCRWPVGYAGNGTAAPLGSAVNEPVEVKVSGDTHTTWRVFCRNGADSCPVLPRLDRAKAIETARQHVSDTGHRSDVVRVRFETVLHVEAPLTGPGLLAD